MNDFDKETKQTIDPKNNILNELLEKIPFDSKLVLVDYGIPVGREIPQ